VGLGDDLGTWGGDKSIESPAPHPSPCPGHSAHLCQPRNGGGAQQAGGVVKQQHHLGQQLRHRVGTKTYLRVLTNSQAQTHARNRMHLHNRAARPPPFYPSQVTCQPGGTCVGRVCVRVCVCACVCDRGDMGHATDLHRTKAAQAPER
jgi:hypothetical protein